MKISREQSLAKDKKASSTAPSKTGKSFKEVMQESPSCMPPPPQPIPFRDESKEEKDVPAILSMPLSSPYLYPCYKAMEIQSLAPVYAAELSHLLEKLGAEMIFMHSDGISKTTLHIDAENVPPLLKGCQISIVEYSSAPKTYNVIITASPEALKLLQSHVHEILSLFQERKFGFSINRIDMELSRSFASFSQEEKTMDDDSEEQQGKENG